MRQSGVGAARHTHYNHKTKNSHFVIFHYSTFKNLWGWFILFLTVYTALAVPFNVAFGTGKTESLVLDSIVDVIFMSDVLINFVTTIVGAGGEIITDPMIIRMNYPESLVIYMKV